jgi:hypothetical protein
MKQIMQVKRFQMTVLQEENDSQDINFMVKNKFRNPLSNAF